MTFDVEVVSVHYKTPDFIYRQYKTVREFYPQIKYRIIDGSDDGQMYFEDLEKNDENFTVCRFGYNIHHGPGMDHAIKSSIHPYLLILDSDVSLIKPLLDEMFSLLGTGYSVGKKIMVRGDGFELWQTPGSDKSFFVYEYIHPYCMLISKEEYLKYKPFIKHGAPCISAMMDIYNKGVKGNLFHFNIVEYVDLTIRRGTRNRWGMGF